MSSPHQYSELFPYNSEIKATIIKLLGQILVRDISFHSREEMTTPSLFLLQSCCVWMPKLFQVRLDFSITWELILPLPSPFLLCKWQYTFWKINHWKRGNFNLWHKQHAGQVGWSGNTELFRLARTEEMKISSLRVEDLSLRKYKPIFKYALYHQHFFATEHHSNLSHGGI